MVMYPVRFVKCVFWKWVHDNKVDQFSKDMKLQYFSNISYSRSCWKFHITKKIKLSQDQHPLSLFLLLNQSQPIILCLGPRNIVWSSHIESYVSTPSIWDNIHWFKISHAVQAISFMVVYLVHLTFYNINVKLKKGNIFFMYCVWCRKDHLLFIMWPVQSCASKQIAILSAKLIRLDESLQCLSYTGLRKNALNLKLLWTINSFDGIFF